MCMEHGQDDRATSRGIAEAKARQMFAEGFLGALTERIADAGIREKVAESILRKAE